MTGDKERIQKLIDDGQAAFDAGDRTGAHALWQQAAHLDPKNEQVWLSLLDVVRGDADRRTCLENLLRINPDNDRARRQLRVLDYMRPLQPRPEVEQPRPRRQVLVWLFRMLTTLVILILLFFIGLALGVLLNQL